MSEREEVKEEKKQKKSGNTFVVVFFALLMIGLSVACGWFANSYFGSVNNKSSEGKEESKEESKAEWKSLGTDISKVRDTYDALKDYMYIKNLPNGGLSLSKTETMNIVAQKYQETDLINVEEDKYYNGHGFLSYDKANSILRKYLGDHYKINTTCDTSWCELGRYVCTYISEYNSDTKLFMVKWGACDGHGTTGPGDTFKYYFTPLRKITDVQENADEMKVIEKVIYVSYISSHLSNVDGKQYYSESYNVYSDLQKTNHIGQLEVKSNKNYIDDFIDKAGTLTSLYRKASDGTYYFVSSEING